MLDSHAPLPGDLDPARGPGASELDLLRIVCAVAWCDGDFSDDERLLLSRLVARYLSPPDGAGPSPEAVDVIASRAASLELLDTLPKALQTPEDRQLAVKLAYMMVRVGRAPGDVQAINPQEKRAYRRLVDGLYLSEDELKACEWAGEQELRAHSGGLLGLLRQRCGGLDAWSEEGLREESGAPQW
jgi:hypothetical protein